MKWEEFEKNTMEDPVRYIRRVLPNFKRDFPKNPLARIIGVEAERLRLTWEFNRIYRANNESEEVAIHHFSEDLEVEAAIVAKFPDELPKELRPSYKFCKR